ncbi:uncharacterized protein PV09_02122 [Verruconis gallopava]|uniref:Uncharacterized protein n=1 Tax=Verruconis gallopava TaxID=253628 RepID=A0A0D1Z2T8_9PEZI|nr:uncharacterized protein PV09_02122 [Verruconis gallopava]KIW07267.1 hypothetical protein PV09_02122 [Verruconis gallopava]
MSETRKNSTASISSVKGAMKTVGRLYKEHHEATQAAWEALYGLHPTPATSRRASTESTESNPSSVSKAWSSIKKRAVEHHKGVNNAYMAYYGIPSDARA